MNRNAHENHTFTENWEVSTKSTKQDPVSAVKDKSCINGECLHSHSLIMDGICCMHLHTSYIKEWQQEKKKKKTSASCLSPRTFHCKWTTTSQLLLSSSNTASQLDGNFQASLILTPNLPPEIQPFVLLHITGESKSLPSSSIISLSKPLKVTWTAACELDQLHFLNQQLSEVWSLRCKVQLWFS